jgi:hypothetical protein
MPTQLNRFELENFGKMAANAYLDEGQDLNETITKLAQEHDLNGHQINRVVENSNILVNGALVTKARENHEDPRVTFPLANSAQIMEALSDHKQASLHKEAAVKKLFTVAPADIDRQRVVDGVFGKLASDPYAHEFASRDHVVMAADFVKNAAKASADAETTTAATLSYVCATLASMENRALTDHSLAKVAMDEAESELRQEINDQILSGLSPATVRDVVKAAGLDKATSKYLDVLVTKVASGLRAREGQSAFVDRSLVNKQHPLIVKAAEVSQRVQAAVQSRQGLRKLSASHQAARLHYGRAVREGR